MSSSPGVEGTETATGVGVAGKIISYIIISHIEKYAEQGTKMDRIRY